MRKTPQTSEAQPRRLAREARSHGAGAKFRAMVDKLMSRFALLEVEQQATGMPRNETDGATVTLLWQCIEEG